MTKQSEIEKKVLNIHGKMALIKADLAAIEMKKSGYNKHQQFGYLELKDFMPHILKLNAKYGINSVFNRNYEEAELILYDTDSESTLEFKMPYNYDGIGMLKGIQKDGGANTYLRRFLYIAAYDIADNDTIDSADNSKVADVPRRKSNTAQQKMELALYKQEMAAAMSKAEATIVYRKYANKISTEEAAGIGAKRMNELKAIEKEKKEVLKHKPEIDTLKAETTKAAIETKLNTKLIDVEPNIDKSSDSEGKEHETK